MFAIIEDSMKEIIDSHVHLWDLEKLNYPWLKAEPGIMRTFLARDYNEAMAGWPVDKMVVVQGECEPGSYLDEVRFINGQAAEEPRIQGIVAYAPVEDPRLIPGALEELAKVPLVKGIRRMYDDHPPLCYSKTFIEGVKRLAPYRFTFDISVKPHAIPATIRMIEKCPDTQFVLDHLGKPDIAGGGWAAYREHMAVLSSFPHVAAKISGLATEARRNAWTVDDLAPYVHHAVEKWGFDRLLFGSDWPVVLLASSYTKWIDALMHILQDTTPEEKVKIFCSNAAGIYRL